MKLETGWFKYLHRHKKREMCIIFSGCPEKIFKSALELGAGDGFQSDLLSRYAERLISTDLDMGILKKNGSGLVEYRTCNAEQVNKLFRKGEFDLVFSSNLLEHLSDPEAALKGIHEVLDDGGITIHIMPNPFWKFCNLLIRFPYMCVIALDMAVKVGRASREERFYVKAKTGKQSIFHAFIPRPHGASGSNIKEFYLFSKARWKRCFEKAGLDLVRVIKGPVASGYGFGLEGLRNFMEGAGFGSEYIYVAVKRNKDSRFRQYFDKI